MLSICIVFGVLSENYPIADGGLGFDAAAITYGTGLQRMADRVDALGGRFEVTSSRGAGTTVAGTSRSLGLSKKGPSFDRSRVSAPLAP